MNRLRHRLTSLVCGEVLEFMSQPPGRGSGRSETSTIRGSAGASPCRYADYSVLKFALVVFAVMAPLGSAFAQEIEGFTEPYRQIELAVGEPGILAEIHVQEGSRVAKGDLVAALDTDVLRATLDLARERSASAGALQASQAELELRQAQLRQLQTLRERGHATQRELERAETDFRIAKARVLMAKEELRLHQLEMKRIEIQIARRQFRSPIDGVVSEVFKDVGEAFIGSDPRVATIVQLGRLRARFAASLRNASGLRAGQTVRLFLPDTQQRASGVVETISPVMDAESGTVQVVVVIDNDGEQLRSGARCLLRSTTSGEAKGD